MHASDDFNRAFGSVNSVRYAEDGTLDGGADPRRDGKAIGFWSGTDQFPISFGFPETAPFDAVSGPNKTFAARKSPVFQKGEQKP